MSSCNLDHSTEDVQKKLQSQQMYLPETLFKQVKHFLSTSPKQQYLNEVFHLLKKYDLASEEEQQLRIKQLEKITNS